MYSTVFILRWCALAGMAVGTAQAAPVRESSDISSRGELNILVGGDVALRIMPLGASITFGTQSTDGNGYRQDLRNLLVADSNPVDMVGSQANGTMEDNQNEGWPGFRISQVLDKAKSSVPSRLPNLVLINAGTNNCIQNVDVDKAKNQTLEMLQYLWAASPKASIALSTLLVNGNANVEKCVLGVNEQLRALVQEQQAISKKVVLADMHTGAGPQKGDLVDGIHPNDAGYAKMAAIWFESIKDAASRGWLEAPQVLPGGGEAPPSTGSGTIP